MLGGGDGNVDAKGCLDLSFSARSALGGGMDEDVRVAAALLKAPSLANDSARLVLAAFWIWSLCGGREMLGILELRAACNSSSNWPASQSARRSRMDWVAEERFLWFGAARMAAKKRNIFV